MLFSAMQLERDHIFGPIRIMMETVQRINCLKQTTYFMDGLYRYSFVVLFVLHFRSLGIRWSLFCLQCAVREMARHIWRS